MMRRVLTGIALLAVAGLAGCASAPEAEITAANSAQQAAMTAEAEQYAPDSYRMAMDTLNAANAAKSESDSKFALFRSYGSSKDMYVRAEALMKQAESEAATAKEAMRGEVQALMATAQASVDSAATAVRTAPMGKGNRAEIELYKTELASITASLADANNDFNNGQFIAARAKVQAVIDNANRIRGDINAARR